jgi:hypothetical protein
MRRGIQGEMKKAEMPRQGNITAFFKIKERKRCKKVRIYTVRGLTKTKSDP